MKISELASQVGINAPTIRYYEEIGLLPRPQRAANGYRVYGQTDLDRLRFVTRSRALDFDLDVIGEIIDYRERGVSPCDYVLNQIDAKITEVDAVPKKSPKASTVTPTTTNHLLLRYIFHIPFLTCRCGPSGRSGLITVLITG